MLCASMQWLEFEKRKKDHLELALSNSVEASELNDFDLIRLEPLALPEINFQDVVLRTKSLLGELRTPFLLSSMTAGHGAQSLDLNLRLAQACSHRGWLMGLGSQRRELSDPEAKSEWKALRSKVPDLRILGNIGLAQVIENSVDHVLRLVDHVQASALIVHCNALQEVIQPEGTPFFSGGLRALEKLRLKAPVPIVVKEVGCGIGPRSLLQLQEIGIEIVDVAGAGGTHWGRIEGLRSTDGSQQSKLAKTFAGWGISTVECLIEAKKLYQQEANSGVNSGVKSAPEIWASGGIRSGLDAAKALALGSTVVGMAAPLLRAALISDKDLHQKMEDIESELKVAQFITGCRTPQELSRALKIRGASSPGFKVTARK